MLGGATPSDTPSIGVHIGGGSACSIDMSIFADATFHLTAAVYFKAIRMIPSGSFCETPTASPPTQAQSRDPGATKQPDGQITQKPVQPCCEKYSAFAVAQISDLNPAVSPDERGGSRSSRTRGGMQWTRKLARDERKPKRTAKPCGPDAPTLASSS